MMQAGDADIADVPAANRSQMDELVGALQVYDPEANTYGPAAEVCGYDADALGCCEVHRLRRWRNRQWRPVPARLGRPALAWTCSCSTGTLPPPRKARTPTSAPATWMAMASRLTSSVMSTSARRSAYCFDYDTFIADVFTGEAVQSMPV